MGPKSLVNQEQVNKAVSILLRAPTLTVREAMLAAEFTTQEADNKAIQRKVARSLPGKSKGGLEDNSTGSRPLANVDINT